ncbi:Lyzozyme M1 (1,4-beta-N-acetylmuramidase), GH25 family [Mesorhizobium sp. YR577]|nr:Lyzozyme M1 (1,4-beta-N-acetylmuramidase), GH25 family [Mesorhizobium sp. YR577]
MIYRNRPLRFFTHRPRRKALLALGAAMALHLAPAMASDFSEPWKSSDRALVVDAYEYNAIDWPKLATDKRIVGFINKASDGLSPPYACSGNETEVKLCKALWKRHAVARELYQTRKSMAKALGLKWGAYHLARPGNPIDQANNFIDFAAPDADDLMAIDIEENDPTKWMSLEDAEEFVRHIQRRTGRFPILYTNGTTAQHIADNREKYPLLSRLPLWYARYKPEIGLHFPKGNWQSYALWQFSAQANCSARSCPYRIPGTETDIDVNVAPMNAEDLRRAWPFGGLLDVPMEMIASVPLPIGREVGLAGEVTLSYASVEPASAIAALENAFQVRGQQHPDRFGIAVADEPAIALAKAEVGLFGKVAAYFASLTQRVVLAFSDTPGVDPITTATIPARTEVP